MAYNHGREDRKWRIWKEAEEKLLRECGVDEATIEQIRMHGMKWDNPECIHSVDEAIKYINEFGFLPLFKNDIDGFSLEERTVPEYWWSDNPEIDPWMWRAIIARRHDIVYGKFFDKKAGFISKKWLPVFANYRRDGYDFDALYDDGKAPNKHKKIMVNFMEDNADSEIYSNELKKQAGFGKDGEKGFDGAITNLMMQTYLCNCDFKKRLFSFAHRSNPSRLPVVT